MVEAGSRGVPLAFVVSSSGPGVTPAEQERYSLLTSLTRHGTSSKPRSTRHWAISTSSSRWRAARALRGGSEADPASRWPSAYDSDEAGLWDFLVDICDYDPAPAMERIQAPVLALFGAGDTIVPVDGERRHLPEGRATRSADGGRLPRRRPSRPGRRPATSGRRLSRDALVLRHGSVSASFAPLTDKPGSVPPPIT